MLLQICVDNVEMVGPHVIYVDPVKGETAPNSNTGEKNFLAVAGGGTDGFL